MSNVIPFPVHVLVGSRLSPCDCVRREVSYCVFCEAGLALCVICGGAEASLPRHCPGSMMSDVRAQDVQDGVADYDVRRGWYCKEEA